MCAQRPSDGGTRGRLLEQQAALAEFGRHALESENLEFILQKACELVSHGLRVKIAKVLEARAGGDKILLRAAIGIPPDIARPGVTEVPADSGSAAGHALKTGQPVISDVDSETRFEIAQIVRAVGARTSANVIILGREAPYGVLEVDSVEPRAFTEDDLHFLQTYANLISAAVDRQRTQQRLAELAGQRELLLNELQHRTKNDLHMILAMLTLEAGQTDNVEVRARLDNVRGRVEALGLLNERLAVSAAVDRVELADYLADLCQARFHMRGQQSGSEGIRLALDLAPLSIDRRRALSVGLVANEFVTNSLKYAFPLGTGVVSVTLDKPAPGRIRLLLADDGIGIRRDPGRPHGGLGLRLVDLLARQLGAETHWSTTDGTQLEIRFPE